MLEQFWKNGFHVYYGIDGNHYVFTSEDTTNHQFQPGTRENTYSLDEMLKSGKKYITGKIMDEKLLNLCFVNWPIVREH